MQRPSSLIAAQKTIGIWKVFLPKERSHQGQNLRLLHKDQHLIIHATAKKCQEEKTLESPASEIYFRRMQPLSYISSSYLSPLICPPPPSPPSLCLLLEHLRKREIQLAIPPSQVTGRKKALIFIANEDTQMPLWTIIEKMKLKKVNFFLSFPSNLCFWELFESRSIPVLLCPSCVHPPPCWALDSCPRISILCPWRRKRKRRRRRRRREKASEGEKAFKVRGGGKIPDGGCRWSWWWGCRYH